MAVSQFEAAALGGPLGDHLFKARDGAIAPPSGTRVGFGQMKPEAVAKYGSVAMHSIIFVYTVPTLMAELLTNPIWQFWTHTSIVVEQPTPPSLPVME
jgi:hypothetical protein